MSLSVTEQERLATLDECISTCEEAVSLLSAVASPGTKEKLPPRERAKVDAACAYTANALYFAYMNTQGVDPKGHPVMEQLRLVQEMQNKIRQRESGGTGAATGPEKRTLALDKDAAARLVRHAQGPGQGGGPAK